VDSQESGEAARLGEGCAFPWLSTERDPRSMIHESWIITTTTGQ